ncbi:hypothetical protein AAF712_016032 [Marasmius tenuissimus]|uniref:Uncharacterized protein n=1 Tax=Marasmius tenuissimus TaxID=585030 RepID=A0ABR2Z7K9_9AGAR
MPTKWKNQASGSENQPAPTPKPTKRSKTDSTKADAKKSKGGKGSGQVDGSSSGGRITYVNWSNEPASLTDRMLTKIEDSATLREAFSLQRIAGVPANNSQGKKVREHYEDLAYIVFFEPGAPEGTWSPYTKELLGKVVQNRLTWFKSHFVAHRDKLGQTSHGIVMEDREGTLHGELSNTWGKLVVSP